MKIDKLHSKTKSRYRYESILRNYLLSIKSHPRITGKRPLVTIEDAARGNIEVSLMQSLNVASEFKLHLKSSRQAINGSTVDVLFRSTGDIYFKSDERHIQDFVKTHEELLYKATDTAITDKLNEVIRFNRESKPLQFLLSLNPDRGWSEVKYPAGKMVKYRMDDFGTIFNGNAITGRRIDAALDKVVDDVNAAYSSLIASGHGELANVEGEYTLIPYSIYTESSYWFRRAAIFYQLIEYALYQSGRIDRMNIRKLPDVLTCYCLGDEYEHDDEGMLETIDEIVKADDWLSWFKSYVSYSGEYPFESISIGGKYQLTYRERKFPIVYGGMNLLILKDEAVFHFIPSYGLLQANDPIGLKEMLGEIPTTPEEDMIPTFERLLTESSTLNTDIFEVLPVNATEYGNAVMLLFQYYNLVNGIWSY